jgi:hypothetical protein
MRTIGHLDRRAPNNEMSAERRLLQIRVAKKDAFLDELSDVYMDCPPDHARAAYGAV